MTKGEQERGVVRGEVRVVVVAVFPIILSYLKLPRFSLKKETRTVCVGGGEALSEPRSIRGPAF